MHRPFTACSGTLRPDSPARFQDSRYSEDSSWLDILPYRVLKVVLKRTRFGALFGGGSPIGFLTFLGSFIGGFFGVGGSFRSDGDFALLLNICLGFSVSILC